MFYFILPEKEKPIHHHRRGCAFPKFTRFDFAPADDGFWMLRATCAACGSELEMRGTLAARRRAGRWHVEVPRLSTPKLGPALITPA